MSFSCKVAGTQISEIVGTHLSFPHVRESPKQPEITWKQNDRSRVIDTETKSRFRVLDKTKTTRKHNDRFCEIWVPEAGYIT